MVETYDTLIMLAAKLILMISFIYSLKYWYDKKNSIIPVVIYWLLGLFFVLLMSYLVFEWLIINAVNSNEYGSLAAIFAIVFYVGIGIKKFIKK